MKKTPQVFLIVATVSVTTIPMMSAVSCSLFRSNRSSYEFYNYEDYMSTSGDASEPSVRENIARAYNYYEFGDLPEIETGIADHVVGAAISSDYFSTMLAGKGKIAKLDFAQLYGITADRSQWASILENNIYTPAVWKLLTSFRINKTDNNGNWLDHDGKRTNDINKVSHDVDGDGVEDFLWEYMAPYFIQNKVIGVNVDKMLNYTNAPTSIKVDANHDGHSDITQNDFDNLFVSDRSYKGILNRLRSWGAKQLSVNDYMRDNMMIGAESASGINGFTGQVQSQNDVNQMINGFKNTVSSWSTTYITSGVGNLESLIHAEGGDTVADAALMYNGDALFAWLGGNDVADAGKIRFVTPANPSFLLDGLVVPTYMQNNTKEWNQVFDVMRTSLYGDASRPYDPASANDTTRAAFIDNNNLYQNFDAVGYTPTFSGLYDYVADPHSSYFDSALNSPATALYKSVADNLGHIDSQHVTYPITASLFSYASDKYLKVKMS